jgi:hypothetical protein
MDALKIPQRRLSGNLNSLSLEGEGAVGQALGRDFWKPRLKSTVLGQNSSSSTKKLREETG